MLRIWRIVESSVLCGGTPTPEILLEVDRCSHAEERHPVTLPDRIENVEFNQIAKREHPARGVIQLKHGMELSPSRLRAKKPSSNSGYRSPDVASGIRSRLTGRAPVQVVQE